MRPNIVFMGSPEFALPTLRALTQDYPVVGVITQPDRPAGRGRVLTPPPIKTLAQELGLPFIQPLRLKDVDALAQLQKWKPDLIVVAAFGQILRQAVLDLPHMGCINVHASLLPRWRGAAPIQAAILHGDAQTGITIMRMDAGVDTGPILKQCAISILPEDTAHSLSERLANVGADLLLETLPAYLAGRLTPQAQPETDATYAQMLRKEDGELIFEHPAKTLQRQIQAFTPWPGAFTFWQGQLLKVLQAHAVISPPPAHLAIAAGTAFIYNGMPAITTGQGFLVIDLLQPANKKPMPGKTFLQGAHNWENAILGRLGT